MLALAGTEQPYFRRDLATAPLKLAMPLRSHRRTSYFRRQQATAPLKLNISRSRGPQVVVTSVATQRRPH